MSWTKDELIDGVRCEKCYPRAFGEMVNDNADNLFLYKDLGGNTRCFCKKHMSFCKKDGMSCYEGKSFTIDTPGVKPSYGAILKSEIICDVSKQEGVIDDN